MNRRSFLGLALVSALSPGALWAMAEEPGALGAEPAELYRIRIRNEPRGAIELSTDGGQRWDALGAVVRPASALGVVNEVISAVPSGCVAGVGADHVLLRVPAGKAQFRQLRVLAAGLPPAGSAITTDVPARGSLFRLLAPPPGSKVLLEKGERSVPLEVGYLPRVGDALVIVVASPAAAASPGIMLENREGGDVLWMVPGGIPRIVARVKHPLKGIGRYSGTERAGAGSVLSWAPTAVLVSTSGRKRQADEKAEDRGGFVIQPIEPLLKGATNPDSQILLEALPEGQGKPAVSPFFGLPVPVSSGDPLDPAPTRVEVRIDEGEWEAFPDLRGGVDEQGMLKALEAALGGKRAVKTGITHLRVTSAGHSAESFRRRVRLAVTPLEEVPQRGIVKIRASVMGSGIEYVSFVLNGHQAKLTNVQPFTWEWDTAKELNGEHLIEIRGLDRNGGAISSVMRRVFVDN